MAAAIGAGGAFFVVHEMTMLKFPLASIGREEIPDTRAATGYRFLKHVACHTEKLLDLGDGEATGSGVGMEAGAKQNLIGIDVPDPCDHLLMHEEGLEPPGATLHDSKKLLPSDRQRIAAEPPCEVGLQTLLIKQR